MKPDEFKHRALCEVMGVLWSEGNKYVKDGVEDFRIGIELHFRSLGTAHYKIIASWIKDETRHKVEGRIFTLTDLPDDIELTHFVREVCEVVRKKQEKEDK